MLRWLWAAMLLAATADAWKPPPQPLILNPNLQHTRTRRSTPTQHLQIFNWNLELQENPAIRSPYYDDCRFYKGRVIDEDGSVATVTECDGQFYGLLQVEEEEFVLQPLEGKNDHVLRRRDVVYSEQPVVYNLTDDTIVDLELDLEDEEPPSMHVRPRNSDPSGVGYYRNILPVTRPVSGVKGLWLEIAIVADHTMVKFHSRERVKHYILALMNIVSAIFNDPSLESNMTLVINKLFLYEEKDPVIRYGNVRKSLEAVNKWNYRHLLKLPMESTGWDAAVWLTRAQLGGPSGFAPVGGVCSHTRSAAIDRDEGLTSAFVIAHELGHLLGLTHDGEGNCEESGREGSVMAPTVLATLHNYAWSSCSKKQFHEKSQGWWCLHERSKDDGVQLGGAKELSNYVFTMDEQCRTEFGEGFSVCKSVKVKSACSRLWCAHRSVPHVCRSKRAPPLEGTPCGKNYWCLDQVCEPMPGQVEEERQDKNIDTLGPAHWEEWGPWSACNAGCGYGLRMRTRRCWRGRSLTENCEGAASQVSTCWAGKVCAARRDMRADLCARHGTRFIPHVQSDVAKYCEVWCVDFSGGDPSGYGTLPDGTSCSYERPYDICFQGTCVKGHCNSSDPACNWCPDGSCSNYTHVHHRVLGKGWSRMVLVPHDAQELSIHIATSVPLHIAMRERRREKHILELSQHHKKQFEVEGTQEKYLKYDTSVPQNLQIIEVDSHVINLKEQTHYGWEGSAVSAGAVIAWNQTDTDIYIWSKSQLQSDLMIMALPESPIPDDETLTVQVSTNFSTPAGRVRPMEYRWSTERGPCSVSCGGGVRTVRLRCPRGQKCGPARYERCNTHKCEFAWAPSEWEECSATCGGDGIQERQLFCVPINTSTPSRRELIEHSVSPALCTAVSPNTRQPCNRVHCPVYWQEMAWTPCSTTCGRGTSYRPLMCPGADDAYCGPKPRERRRRCRQRRCPSAPRTLKACHGDSTQNCELFTFEQLKKNCVVAPFRKYCCETCRSIDGIEHRGEG